MGVKEIRERVLDSEGKWLSSREIKKVVKELEMEKLKKVPKEKKKEKGRRGRPAKTFTDEQKGFILKCSDDGLAARAIQTKLAEEFELVFHFNTIIDFIKRERGEYPRRPKKVKEDDTYMEKVRQEEQVLCETCKKAPARPGSFHCQNCEEGYEQSKIMG